MNERIEIQHSLSANVYAAVWNGSGHVLDFSDSVFKALGSHAINAVTTGGAGAGAFRVAGDITASLVVGRHIRVRGSTGNDGVYAIRAGSAFAGGNTTVNVAEAVADATVDGTLDLNATPALTLTGTQVTADRTLYRANLNLSLVSDDLQYVEATAVCYLRAGSFAVPLTDSFLGSFPVDAQLGKRGQRRLQVKAGLSLRTTGGQSAQIFVELLADDQRVPLFDLDPAAECEVDVWVHNDPAAPLFSVDAAGMGAVNEEHRFEADYANPNPTSDSQHSVSARITAVGQLFVIDGKPALEGDVLFYGIP